MNDKKRSSGKKDNKPALSSSTGEAKPAKKAEAQPAAKTATQPASPAAPKASSSEGNGSSGGGWMTPAALLFGLIGTGFSGYLYTQLKSLGENTTSMLTSQAESAKTDVASVQTSVDEKTSQLSSTLEEKTASLGSLIEEKTSSLQALIDEKTTSLSESIDSTAASIRTEASVSNETLATSTASAVQELTSRTELEINNVSTTLNTGLAMLRDDSEQSLATVNQRLVELDESVQATNELASRGQRDWVLAEVNYLLRTGVHRVKLAGDVKAGVIALESASDRLHTLADINYLPVREQIAEEVAALRRVGPPDIEGLIFKLQHMSKRADTLPLPPTDAEKIKEQLMEDPARTGIELGKSLLDRFKPSVAVVPSETVGDEPKAGRRAKPTKEQLTASESLRLHLQAARLSALRHDSETFINHMDNAIEYSSDIFDTETEQVKTYLADLQEIRDTSIVPRVPALGSSLALFTKIDAKRGEH